MLSSTTIISQVLDAFHILIKSVLDPHLEFYIYIHIRLKLSIVYIEETLGMFLVHVKYKLIK